MKPRFARPKLGVNSQVQTRHLWSQDQDFKSLAGAAAQVTLRFAFGDLVGIGPTKECYISVSQELPLK